MKRGGSDKVNIVGLTNTQIMSTRGEQFGWVRVTKGCICIKKWTALIVTRWASPQVITLEEVEAYPSPPPKHFKTRGSQYFCVLETYAVRHVQFRMAGFYLSQTKTGLPPPRRCYLHLWSKLLKHPKVKSSRFCLFTRVCP